VFNAVCVFPLLLLSFLLHKKIDQRIEERKRNNEGIESFRNKKTSEVKAGREHNMSILCNNNKNVSEKEEIVLYSSRGKSHTHLDIQTNAVSQEGNIHKDDRIRERERTRGRNNFTNSTRVESRLGRHMKRRKETHTTKHEKVKETKMKEQKHLHCNQNANHIQFHVISFFLLLLLSCTSFPCSSSILLDVFVSLTTSVDMKELLLFLILVLIQETSDVALDFLVSVFVCIVLLVHWFV
jgi:hypothetical protein